MEKGCGCERECVCVWYIFMSCSSWSRYMGPTSFFEELVVYKNVMNIIRASYDRSMAHTDSDTLFGWRKRPPQKMGARQKTAAVLSTEEKQPS